MLPPGILPPLDLRPSESPGASVSLRSRTHAPAATLGRATGVDTYVQAPPRDRVGVERADGRDGAVAWRMWSEHGGRGVEACRDPQLAFALVAREGDDRPACGPSEGHGPSTSEGDDSPALGLSKNQSPSTSEGRAEALRRLQAASPAPLADQVVALRGEVAKLRGERDALALTLGIVAGLVLLMIVTLLATRSRGSAAVYVSSTPQAASRPVWVPPAPRLSIPAVVESNVRLAEGDATSDAPDPMRVTSPGAGRSWLPSPVASPPPAPEQTRHLALPILVERSEENEAPVARVELGARHPPTRLDD